MNDDYFDFIVKIKCQSVSLNSKNRIRVEIFSSNFYDIDKRSIVEFDGIPYKFKNEKNINNIEKFISDYFNKLLKWSKSQNNDNLEKYGYDGGTNRKIEIKYGQTTIRINGQVQDIKKQCDEFIEKFKKMILEECEKSSYEEIVEETMNDFTKQCIANAEDKEYAKYSYLFQIRFGRKPYIVEPSGTREQTIEAIKKCLEEDKDILDEILFPQNDVIY